MKTDYIIFLLEIVLERYVRHSNEGNKPIFRRCNLAKLFKLSVVFTSDFLKNKIVATWNSKKKRHIAT